VGLIGVIFHVQANPAPKLNPNPTNQHITQTITFSTPRILVFANRGGSYTMNANAFRHFYEYHFAENHKIWETVITSLSHERFTQHVGYSHGSVRDQIVHLVSVDDTWFSGLRGDDIPEPLDPANFGDQEIIRSHWDNVEQNMREYLAKLRDDMLFEKPFAEGEDKDLILWQVLLHVVNHGTDHRAQLLRLLNDLSVNTAPQDYIFYVYSTL
jgi:uncharacterized damage-inducible protein DinB